MLKVYKNIAIALMIAVVLSAVPAYAAVTGDDSIEFTFTGALPDLIQVGSNVYVANNPGSSSSGGSSLYINSGSLTNGNSTAAYTLGGPAAYMYTDATGTWKTMFWKNEYGTNPADYSLSKSSSTLSAQVPAGLTSTSAQSGLNGYFLYGGYLPQWGMGYGQDITTLPGFSYTYDFNGKADTTDDRMAFAAQLEIYNFINSDDSHPNTILYSDYDPSAPGFRSKMPYYLYNPYNPYSLEPGAQVVGPDINETGTVSFGPYTEETPHTWAVRWDMGGYVEDFATGAPIDPTPAVPEPASMLLFAIGGGALALIRKRRKNI